MRACEIQRSRDHSVVPRVRPALPTSVAKTGQCDATTHTLTVAREWPESGGIRRVLLRPARPVGGTNKSALHGTVHWCHG